MAMKPSGKRKRSNTSTSSPSTVLPNDLLSQIEYSDKQSSKRRKKRIVNESLPQSRAAKGQLDIQVSLMECRILMQNALTAALSPSDSNSGASDESSDGGGNSEKSSVKGVDKLLNQLLQARQTLSNLNDSSESDEENDSNDNKDINKKLQSEYSILREEWKSVLDRRHASLKLHNSSSNANNSTKFSVIDQSFWTQVENTLRHELFLQASNQAAATSTDGSDDTSPPIYDDSKIYRYMLNEFIKLRSERQEGTEDAAQAAAERIRKSIEKKERSSSSSNNNNGGSGSSTKNNYGETNEDRRSSKGRKIRYVVNEKLTNFTFPAPREILPSMGEDVLFKSMFGGVIGSRK